MKMTIVRPDWKREVTMKGWSLGTEYSLILITGPARDKGQAFLKRDNEMWNWQPSIDRVVKLPPSMMLQSWMGSDFTNDDLVKESSVVNDYTHSLDQDSVIEGKKVYKIVLTP
ncbi:MAG TPA: outer membrane lipoprotein-sorting protein, partial [Cytophagales bacterium]|nr:outer membrane lipoprotein-sorting protein [Cytophagales bacterium]